jgi:hypothetical protein
VTLHGGLGHVPEMAVGATVGETARYIEGALTKANMSLRWLACSYRWPRLLPRVNRCSIRLRIEVARR